MLRRSVRIPIWASCYIQSTTEIVSIEMVYCRACREGFQVANMENGLKTSTCPNCGCNSDYRNHTDRQVHHGHFKRVRPMFEPANVILSDPAKSLKGLEDHMDKVVE